MFLKISFHIGRIRIRNDNTGFGSGSEENIPDPTGSGSATLLKVKLNSLQDNVYLEFNNGLEVGNLGGGAGYTLYTRPLLVFYRQENI